MDRITTNKKLNASINIDYPYAEKDNLEAVIKSLELELGKAAMKVFKGDKNIITMINYIEYGDGNVMVSASFHC